MTSTTYIHPYLLKFWSLLAYPKFIVKLSALLFLIALFTAYIQTRPEVFVENNAIIIEIEFFKGKMTRGIDSLYIGFRYYYNNKLYEAGDFHQLPWQYPADKVDDYVVSWKKKHDVGDQIKILVNTSQPSFSGLKEQNSKAWFTSFAIYYIRFHWFFTALTLVLISLIIKYFFMRDKNDQ